MKQIQSNALLIASRMRFVVRLATSTVTCPHMSATHAQKSLSSYSVECRSLLPTDKLKKRAHGHSNLHDPVVFRRYPWVKDLGTWRYSGECMYNSKAAAAAALSLKAYSTRMPASSSYAV